MQLVVLDDLLGEARGSLGARVGDVAQAAAAGLLVPSWREKRRYEHQVPPPGGWYGWLLLGGRGCGKTETASWYVDDHVRGTPCLAGLVPHRVAIVGPTLGDAVTSCVNGPSGLRARDPGVRVKLEPGGAMVRWSNGSEAKLFGAATEADVDRLRAGGNRCTVWFEELAAMRYADDAFDQGLFGLRVGPDPRWVASTTPRPRPIIKQFARGFRYRGRWSVPFAGETVVVNHATTDDNPNLPAHVRAALYERYGGRSLGRQELHGELLDEDDAALWKRVWLDEHRLRTADPREVARTMRRLTVGVDPSGGAGEQGIVVFGRRDELRREEGQRRATRVREGFVLDDRTVRESPAGWGRAAVQAAVDWEAGDVVVETNYGGDMAIATITSAAERLGITGIPVRKTTATRGKAVRAEPVAGLAEQGRWHHVGTFEALEDQLCTWSPDEDWSPDRLDAMVWGPWHTRLVGVTSTAEGSFGGRQLAGATVGGDGRRGPVDPRAAGAMGRGRRPR